MAVALDFNYDTKVITVLSPDIQVTCQELVNLIAAEKATSLSIDDVEVIGGAGGETGQSLGYQSIAVWEGKGALGQPGDFTQILIKLLGWKLDFQEFVASGPLETFVLGGSLLAIDINGNSVNPIVSTVNVCTIAQSGSGTFSEAQANKQLQYQIESLQALPYRQTGTAYYVDPVNGDDSNDGLLPERPTAGSKRGPKATFAAAMTLVISGNHDGIYFVQKEVGAPTILDEAILIDKEDVQVRGPGPGFQIRSTSAVLEPVRITAAHVELSGVTLVPKVGGGLSGVDCSAAEPYLKLLTIRDSNDHGIRLTSAASNFHVQQCLIYDCAGEGVHVLGATDGEIIGGRIHDCDIGIHLDATGGAVDGQTLISEVLVHDNTTKGIRIDSGFSESFVRSSVLFSENGTGQTGGASPFHNIENNEASSHITVRSEDVAQQVERNAFLLESHYESHSWQGNSFYVDPLNGRDDWDGSRTAPFATIQAGVDAATDGGHDTVHLVGDVAVTEFDEQITITKDFVTITGPGGGVRVKSTSNGDVFTVSGNGVVLRGFRIQGHTAGTGAGVTCTGNGLRMRYIRLERSQGNGIELFGSDCRIEDVLTNDTDEIGGHGILIDGTATTAKYNIVQDCRLLHCVGDGVKVDGAGALHNTVTQNLIMHCGGAGIRNTATADDSSIHNNRLLGNTDGPIVDLSADSLAQNNEQWAKRNETLYRDRIWINTVGGGTSGDVLGINGTETNPVDNLAEALTLATALGRRRLHVRGSITLTADLDYFEVEGISAGIVNLAGFGCAHTIFRRCFIFGALGGTTTQFKTEDCLLANVTGLRGNHVRSVFSGTTGFFDGTTVNMTNCSGSSAGVATFDMTAPTLFVRLNLAGWSGAVNITNIDHANSMLRASVVGPTIDLAASCTLGIADLAGTANLTDNSAGTVVDATALVPAAVWAAAQAANIDTGTMGELLDDAATKAALAAALAGAG